MKSSESRKTPIILLHSRGLQQTFTGLPATRLMQRRCYPSATQCHLRLWLVLMIVHIVFYFNNPLSSGSCNSTIAEFIQSFFSAQNRDFLVILHCAQESWAKGSNLHNINLSAHWGNKSSNKSAHVWVFVWFEVFWFGNPNDLCKDFLGGRGGKGETASDLKLTVNHNIFSKG